jgi:hypothetical protein
MLSLDERRSVRLHRLINGYQVSQAVHVAATLGVADRFRDGPCGAPELAAALTVEAHALYRLLRALAAVGVFYADTRLLALEDAIGPPNADPYTKLLDVAMMLRTGGAQYPREVWAALFAAGGFRLASITPSPLGPCVLEGAPVEA